MDPGWEEPREGIPAQKHRDTCKRDSTENDRQETLAVAEAHGHTPLFPVSRKETVKTSRDPRPLELSRN